jgi:ABC-2 type transport system permease protein
MIFLRDTIFLTARLFRITRRNPAWLVITLVQPLIWLTLFGQIFKEIVELPGFDSNNYLEYLAPGIVIMTAVFGSAWSGIGIIQDLQQGVMDRLLATPVSRMAIIVARSVHAAGTVTAQALLVLLMALALGAGVPGGIPGGAMILLLAVLLGVGFSAISNGVAFLTKRPETLLALVNFLVLPLTFLSTTFIAEELIPDWIRSIARVNPVNWAVTGARDAMLGRNWADTWDSVVLLVAFMLVAGIFSSVAMRVYQRAE